ncbi:ALDOLASE-RELATED, partial [Salix koriyanagi]
MFLYFLTSSSGWNSSQNPTTSPTLLPPTLSRLLRMVTLVKGLMAGVASLSSYRKALSLRYVVVSVDKLAMKSLEEREEEINRVAEMANLFLGASKDTLIMTSRELITGKTACESLEINFKVSAALVEI